MTDESCKKWGITYIPPLTRDGVVFPAHGVRSDSRDWGVFIESDPQPSPRMAIAQIRDILDQLFPGMDEGVMPGPISYSYDGMKNPTWQEEQTLWKRHEKYLVDDGKIMKGYSYSLESVVEHRDGKWIAGGTVDIWNLGAD